MEKSVRLIQHGGKCCSLTQIVSMVNIFPHRSSSRALTQMPLIPVLLSGDSSWCHHLTASIKVELSCLKRRQRKRTISSLRSFSRNLWGLNCHLRDHPNFGLTFLSLHSHSTQCCLRLNLFISLEILLYKCRVDKKGIVNHASRDLPQGVNSLMPSCVSWVHTR